MLIEGTVVGKARVTIHDSAKNKASCAIKRKDSSNENDDDNDKDDDDDDGDNDDNDTDFLCWAGNTYWNQDTGLKFDFGASHFILKKIASITPTWESTM